MQIQTKLKPMFSYSLLPIIFIIIIILLFFINKKHKNKKELQKKIKITNHKDLISIKEKYIIILQNLSNEINSKTITNRKAYQELSAIIRNFIYEITNIKVQNYTLKEIKEINIPILYELVKEYYDPEFSKTSKGNIYLSIEKTKMVISKWN